MIRQRPQGRGFSLAELMIVVIMLGILAAIAIPKIVNPTDKIISMEARKTLLAVLTAQKMFLLEKGSYAGSSNFDQLDVTIPPSKYFNSPVAVGDPNPGDKVACIWSKDGKLNMEIWDNGRIVCNDVIAGSCQKIGCRGGGTDNTCN